MLYDDKCSLCVGFAKMVNFLAGGRLSIVGHHTKEGERLRNTLLYPEATEMFWMLGQQEAHGGRAALVPLIKSIATARDGVGMLPGSNVCSEDNCGVLLRSASLIRNSRRIEYDLQQQFRSS